MIISYFRSSSFNCHDFCPMQYFGTYVLGHTDKSGFKALKGTICHKVLEMLALIKKAEQDKKKHVIDTDVFGKKTLKSLQKMSVDNITEEAYHHYSTHATHHIWKLIDLRDCKLWVNKTITLNGGMFDPRNRTIVAAEPSFDFEVQEDWAKFKQEENGKIVTKRLALKGTIDLITEISPGFLEIIDWKTGRRLDWATGKEKTYDSLMTDPQLRIYHYAAQQLYPNAENIMITIYFINDGGPFSMSFSKKDLTFTKDMLKKKFEQIKATTIPRLNKTWKCQKLCHFGKNTFENPKIETRTGQFTKPGQPMTMCQELDYMVKTKGLDWVTTNYKKEGHEIGTYKAPGATDD